MWCPRQCFGCSWDLQTLQRADLASLCLAKPLLCSLLLWWSCVVRWRMYFLFASEQRSLLENHLLPVFHSECYPHYPWHRNMVSLETEYERKIIAQHFSLSGTMGLFSLHRGRSRRGKTAELYWSCSSMTERLCVIYLCQTDRSHSVLSVACSLSCCRYTHPQFCSASAISLIIHCFISGNLSLWMMR